MLKKELISLALTWQEKFGVPPQIITAISEYDAAMMVGMSETAYSDYMQTLTAVNKGFDFEFKRVHYQVKSNHPSGKPGSRVTMVSKVKNYDWDKLIWILYDEKYNMQEAWIWDKKDYKVAFENKNRLSPNDMRKGMCLYPKKNKGKR